jgi:AcrR family transcriptional regulator
MNDSSDPRPGTPRPGRATSAQRDRPKLPKMARQNSQRMTGEERRAAVLDAAITEIAEHGYHGTSTNTIARRAGISQPYLYALFPSKKDLFLAAYQQVGEQVRQIFSEAAHADGDPAEKLTRMAQAYRSLLGDRRLLAFQLQAYAACADPEIRSEVSATLVHSMETLESRTGVPRSEVIRFTAFGMYLTIAAAAGLPNEWWPQRAELQAVG